VDDFFLTIFKEKFTFECENTTPENMMNNPASSLTQSTLADQRKIIKKAKKEARDSVNTWYFKAIYHFSLGFYQICYYYVF
jgi:hypothetical protein